MTRAEMMRAARNVVQVTFSEYLRIRASGVPTLVFEGKQCPSFYVGKVAIIIGELAMRQLIARGKRNVIELRELIRRNISTADDLVLFFVDRDFDERPAPDELDDVYVTRGYSIENEVIQRCVLESYIRANFDIADADDERAINEILEEFERAFNAYCRATRDLHKLIFACRKANIRCIPGDEIGRFFEIDWNACKVTARFGSMAELGSLLQLKEEEYEEVKGDVMAASEFDNLDRRLRWRGKYHFDFARKLLVRVAASRVEGKPPFSRPARIAVDPGHPSLLSALSAHTAAPTCLVHFIQKMLGSAAPQEAVNF